MEPYIEIAPGQSMALLPAQWDFIMADERFVAFVGGVGSGKTVAGALKALRYAFAHPGCIGVIGAPNKTVLRDVTERTLRTLLPDGAIAAERKSEGIILLSNGSQLWLRSMEDFEHRRGLSIAFFWLDEGIYCGYEAWRVMKARLRQPGYPVQGWLTSTPRGQDQFYGDFEAAPQPDHRLVRAATRANHFLPAGYAESLGYTGAHALQELEGQFVAREGLVYHLQPTNIAPAPPASEAELVIGGIDWGYRNPFHLSVFGLYNGIIHQLAEFRATQADRERVIIPAALSLTAHYGVQIWYAGPDRPEHIAALNERLHSAAINCTVRTGDNNVVAGIETVRSLLESIPPRLLIDPDCAHTLREFSEYQYPDEVAPGNLAASSADEHPIKAHDHALDALRYALHTHFGAAHQARDAQRLITNLQRRIGYQPPTTNPNTKTTISHETETEDEIHEEQECSHGTTRKFAEGGS